MAFLDHGNIIAWNFRNLVTITIMVTIGWFILHLLGVTVSSLSTLLGQVSGGTGAYANANVGSAGVDYSYSLQANG